MTDADVSIPVGDMDVSVVIVRACRRCGGTREAGADCASCGLTEPPEVTDLGVIAASRSGRLESAWWNTVGSPLADRRIRKANKAAKDLCG